MFKIAAANTLSSKAEARQLLDDIYRENPSYWPHGIDPDGFDGGLFLIREKSAGKAVGFCGWQERHEIDGHKCVKTGYYSIGVLPAYRGNGFAKEALQKLISAKTAGVDRVRALIMESNQPSRKLADALGVPAVLKRASTKFLYPNVITKENLRS